jgi:DNA-binding FadR family transcriptional regulator
MDGMAVTSSGSSSSLFPLAGGKRRSQDALRFALIDTLMSGEIAAHGRLPCEDDLIQRFRVSRPALRQALHYLTAQGMVRPRGRAGVEVLPRANWNYLDPVIFDAALRLKQDDQFQAALMEARALLAPEAASLAATRAGTRQVTEIEDALLQMSEAPSCDSERWQHAVLDFHTTILDASGNWVYRQFTGAIRAALLIGFAGRARRHPDQREIVGLHRAVVDAIRLKRPANARRAMETLVAAGRRDAHTAVPLADL